MSAITKRLAGKVSVFLLAAMLLTIMAPAFAASQPPSLSVTISSFTDSAGSINISVGKAEGIKVGSRGIILRDGKQIADYEVVQVNWGFSRIEVFNLPKGETVRPGDSAPITTPPTVKKASKSKTIWLVAALVAVAALFGGKHGGSGGGGTIDLTAQKTSTNNNGENTSTVTITARINKSDGAPAPNGTPVTFSTTAGTLDRTQTTTDAGRAIATLTHTPSDTQESAVVTVKALGRTATITISFGASISLTATPTTFQIRDSGGSPTSSTITATCIDAMGIPVTGASVKFTTSTGTFTNDTVITDSNGRATTTLTSTTATAPGKATVTAQWLTNRATTLVTITAGPPFSIGVSSATSAVQCDGNSSTTITATVKDVKGNLCTDGTVVDFSVIPDAGGGGNGTITARTTTVRGVATASLFSRDSAGNVSKSGVATIKAEVRRASQPADVPLPTVDIENHSTTVQFISVNIGEMRLSASPTNVRGWDVVGNNVTITAVVYNTDHQPVPNGTAVFFSANFGSIHGTGTGTATMSTTTNGMATATLTTDAAGLSNPTWNGQVDVTVSSGGVSFTQPNLVVFSGPPAAGHCTAVASQTTLASVGGVSTITVTAKDQNDNPIADGVNVTATTSKGTLNSDTDATSGGVAHFTLTTSTDSAHPTPTGDGTVNISIPSGGGTGVPVYLTVSFTVN